MDRHEVLQPGFRRTDDRGEFLEVLNEGHWEALLTGRMRQGAVMGNHYHEKTVVFFYLTEGSVRVRTVDVETMETDRFRLQAEQGVILRTGESHAIDFLEDSSFVMLKSLHYDPKAPDTIEFEVPE